LAIRVEILFVLRFLFFLLQLFLECLKRLGVFNVLIRLSFLNPRFMLLD
jgi:hypothetical protein